MDEPSDTPSEERGITVDELLDRITPRVWVTPALAVLILIGFVVELALGASAVTPTGAELLKVGGEFGPSFVEGQWWRALTSMFLHAGPLHLAFNLWAFWSVGRLTERVFGNAPFLAIYVLSGVGGSLTSLAWSPMTVGVGASGAIFGVYGALFAFVLLHRGVLPPEYLNKQRNSIIGFIGYNIVFGLSQKNTDMAAHAGGFVAGALAGSVLGRDLLHPARGVARRVATAAGLVVVLVLAAFWVRARLLKVPEIKAGRDADAAFAHFEAKQFPQAIERYTQALVHERRYEWLFNRGLAYYELDDVKPAQADFRDAHQLKETVKTHSMLCEIGIRIGGADAVLEEAVKHCSAALALEESPRGKARFLALRAIAHGMGTRVDESVADAEAALLLDPGSVMARAHRAAVNLDKGKLEEAEQDCARLLAEEEPRHFDFDLCARVAHSMKDAIAERSRLDRLLAKTPADRDGLLARAYLHGQQGRLAESVADYDKLVVAFPDLAIAWNNRAWAQVARGEFAAARADADRAVALEASASHLGTRCFALVGLGDLVAARVDCARALELSAPVSVGDRGMLAFIDKRYADARRDWERAGRSDAAMERALRPWLARLPGR